MKAEETKAKPLPIEWWQHLSYEQPLESGDMADIMDKADFLRAMNGHAQNQVEAYKEELRGKIEEDIKFLNSELKYLREKHPSDAMAALGMSYEISGLQKAKSLLTDTKEKEE